MSLSGKEYVSDEQILKEVIKRDKNIMYGSAVKGLDKKNFKEPLILQTI